MLGTLAFAGDLYPNSYNWAKVDLNYHIRRAQLEIEAIKREDRNRRLDRFLLDQGY